MKRHQHMWRHRFRCAESPSVKSGGDSTFCTLIPRQAPLHAEFLPPSLSTLGASLAGRGATVKAACGHRLRRLSALTVVPHPAPVGHRRIDGLDRPSASRSAAAPSRPLRNAAKKVRISTGVHISHGSSRNSTVIPSNDKSFMPACWQAVTSSNNALAVKAMIGTLAVVRRVCESRVPSRAFGRPSGSDRS